MIGRTLAVLADPKGEVERMAAKYGLIYRSRVLGETSISVLGPEANELVLFDQSKLFSSTHGWGPILGLLFPRGLMLLDFEEHRLHRRALSVAFKSDPMKSYLAQLDAGIAARVARWRAQPGPMLFYPAMKQLTLDLAATSFLGADIGPEVDDITPCLCRHGGGIDRADPPALARAPRWRAGSRAASVSSPISRSRFRSAAASRARTCSRSCAGQPHDDGALLSTEDIVDHMSFLMMAAHDTLTSSLTSFVAALAANPHWQDRLRNEVTSLGVAAGEPTTLDNLAAMPLTEMAFKEAMRKKPPVPSIPRRATRDFSFKGYAIPAGTMVGINPLFTPSHAGDLARSRDLRSDALHRRGAAQPPPLRLRAVRRRRAYVPWAALRPHAGQVLCAAFPAEILSVTLEPGTTPDWQMWPIPKPRDGLRVMLSPV